MFHDLVHACRAFWRTRTLSFDGNRINYRATIGWS